MTKTEFIDTGRTLFGEDWEAPMANLLAVSDRNIRRFKAGERAVPALVAAALIALMAARRTPRRGYRPQEVGVRE
jgi:hypothetical protein